MQVVQLVSFGCSTDSITTDKLRSILEQHGNVSEYEFYLWMLLHDHLHARQHIFLSFLNLK